MKFKGGRWIYEVDIKAVKVRVQCLRSWNVFIQVSGRAQRAILEERKVSFLLGCGIKERFRDFITWQTGRNLQHFSCWVEPKSCHECLESSASPRPAGLWCLCGTTCINTHTYEYNWTKYTHRWGFHLININMYAFIHTHKHTHTVWYPHNIQLRLLEHKELFYRHNVK